MIDKLMILYFSGFDYRKVNDNITPYLYSLSEKYPMIKINTIPDVDLKTTMWTGCYPHEHGIWQVRLKEDRNFDTKKPQDYIPEIITTTFQCFIHSITGEFDLAAVPEWRRRRFDIFKTKYQVKHLKGYLNIKGTNSIFDILGENNCNFIYEDRFNKIISAPLKQYIKNRKLELLDLHGTDIFTHWNIHDEEKMNDAYKKVDGCIRDMHAECESRGITMMIMSDHAQAKVEDTIDIVGKIKELGIQKNEISYFVEAPMVRFWFHTDNAREKMLEYLSGNEKGTLLHFEELHRYNIKFNDDSYGEYYFITNPGTIFYPNDFYHPIGNLYLALKNVDQRNRIKSPIYRGYHGHLPYNDCEKGFLMLLDNDYKPDREEIEIIDMVPTVLNLLGYKKPESLKGVHVFND